MAGKKQHLAPIRKKLTKNVDIDELTSCLGHVYLGCTQRECKPNEATIELYTQKCSNPVFLLKQQKSYRDRKNLTHKP